MRILQDIQMTRPTIFRYLEQYIQQCTSIMAVQWLCIIHAVRAKNKLCQWDTSKHAHPLDVLKLGSAPTIISKRSGIMEQSGRTGGTHILPVLYNGQNTTGKI